jgi:rhodanese-related sulfurtransferase
VTNVTGGFDAWRAASLPMEIPSMHLAQKI